MRLTEPRCCDECFYKLQVGAMTVCGNPSFPEEAKTLDISAFKIDKTSIPEWCPIIATNKVIESLPKEKQKAMDDLFNSLSVLLGWKNKEDKDD